MSSSQIEIVLVAFSVCLFSAYGLSSAETSVKNVWAVYAGMGILIVTWVVCISELVAMALR